MLLSKKKKNSMHLMFAKDRIDTPQCYWEKVLWTDKPKAKLFGENNSTISGIREGTACQQENIIAGLVQ